MLASFTLVLSLLVPQAPEGFPADGSRIARPGIPGTLCVYGEDAFAVLTSGDKHPRAVAAAGLVGEGRSFAIAHDGYRGAQHFEEEQGLMRAALRWLQAGESPGKVSLLTPHAGFQETLIGLGFEVVPFDLKTLPELQILFVGGEFRLPLEQEVVVQDWIVSGGALCATVCPWGWLQVHNSQGVNLTEDLAANRFLASAGFQFSDGYAGAKVDGKFVMDRAAAREVSCSILIALIEAKLLPQDLTPLEDALRFLPKEEDTFLPRLLAVLPELKADNAPVPDRALKAKDHPLERLAVIARHQELELSNSTDARTTPGADHFPGASGADATTYAKSLYLDPTVPGWQSTGLYLDPGQVLTLGFDGEGSGWKVRIGAHADRLWHKDRWPRWPEVSRVMPLQPQVQAPSGGLVYFEAESKMAEPLLVVAMGAAEAPYWVSGETSAKVWKRTREAPAPWAELQGKYLILTLPSSAVRDLEDPQELMDWWDRTVAEQFAFGAEPPPERPERFVSDVLISAGYMHAGYPIMMHLDVAEPKANGKPAVLVDLKELQSKGNWGCFHELGHNRQKPSWTFQGTGEVTNNLFSLYSGEVMSGIEPWNNPWLENQKLAGRAYLRDGADFSVWKRKPGIALLCYAQIQKEFGWEPFQATFAAARALPKEERPRSEADKHTFWVRQMSLATGQDLRPFHAHWGWPLEEGLLTDPALANLPVWMPDFKELER